MLHGLIQLPDVVSLQGQRQLTGVRMDLKSGQRGRKKGFKLQEAETTHTLAKKEGQLGIGLNWGPGEETSWNCSDETLLFKGKHPRHKCICGIRNVGAPGGLRRCSA